MRLELIPVPVSDADRALAFYVDSVGFSLDHDHRVGEGLRFIQLTPPGSACSITFGEGIARDMAPGSLKGLQMVVTDIEQARRELEGRGVPLSGYRRHAVGPVRLFQRPGREQLGPAGGPTPGVRARHLRRPSRDQSRRRISISLPAGPATVRPEGTSP